MEELKSINFKNQKKKTNSAVEPEDVNAGLIKIQYNTLTCILW
jgi:hypothetical protein